MTTPTLSALQLREILAPACRVNAIDMMGAVRLPRRLPHTPAYHSWLLQGRHGDLEYMRRDPHGRVDPNRERQWVATLLVFAQRYTNGWAAYDAEAAEGCGAGRPWTAGVSRYARGIDYHDVLRKSIRRVTKLLRETLCARGVTASESDLIAEDAVDAGPFLEREYAWLAGLGFYGRNSMLIHPHLGSGLFLGVALTNLELTGLADAPRPLLGPSAQRLPDSEGMRSLCGKCTSCLEACPTGAIGDDYTVDAGRCLSAWSIEWRGGAPADQRSKQGGLLFGCDICQQVCPWNHKAARKLVEPPPAAYTTLPEYEALDLADLIRMDADAFRVRFRRTPLWRCHPEGLRRNALIVAANTGRSDLVEVMRGSVRDDPDEAVRETARWALTELGETA